MNEFDTVEVPQNFEMDRNVDRLHYDVYNGELGTGQPRNYREFERKMEEIHGELYY